MLPNKGKEFLQILDHHKYFEVMKLIVGDYPIISSYGANIAKKGGVPMDLHTDQWWAPDPVNRKKAFYLFHQLLEKNLTMASISRYFKIMNL